MSIIMDLYVLKKAFLPYIKDIQEFHFYYNNPLVTIFFMILYLTLEIGMSWSPGKAFFFCISTAFILLATTWLEKSLIKIFAIPGYATYNLDPFILKICSLVAISLVVVYFVLIDNS